MIVSLDDTRSLMEIIDNQTEMVIARADYDPLSHTYQTVEIKGASSCSAFCGLF